MVLTTALLFPDVLAEDSTDVLTNVNLVDEEKAEKNRENKRKLAGLGGILQDEEEDLMMGLREKGILEKYDAEIDGPRKAEFTLEANGNYITDHERALKRLQEELQQNRVCIKFLAFNFLSIVFDRITCCICYHSSIFTFD